jgi:hypothetical protein
MKLFTRQTLLIELPEVTGPRLTVAEVKLAMENKGDDPAVRAMVQLLVMTRMDYIKAAQDKAAGDKPATYDLGGAAAIEDTLAEVLGLIDGKTGDDVKRFFTDS